MYAPKMPSRVCTICNKSVVAAFYTVPLSSSHPNTPLKSSVFRTTWFPWDLGTWSKAHPAFLQKCLVPAKKSAGGAHGLPSSLQVEEGSESFTEHSERLSL
ncbi:unnamed protein product [Rangifer tarandus platyrhynchus]|uniref:Uncharacterized protein n=1 Tax=Rangifer tarandus platyrhynchus TaxID=3082113 RepID=A0ABN9A7C2_RANTA|nr:unnamed protein product [Rangifer tarandus platyrhynchus]